MVAQLIGALRYKLEGRRFSSQWCHWNFSLTESFQPHCGPDSASNRNEYQEYFLGSKDGWCVGLTTLPPLHVLIVLKSGSLNLLEPSGLVQACNMIALLFTWLQKWIQTTKNQTDTCLAQIFSNFFRIPKIFTYIYNCHLLVSDTLQDSAAHATRSVWPHCSAEYRCVCCYWSDWRYSLAHYKGISILIAKLWHAYCQSVIVSIQTAVGLRTFPYCMYLQRKSHWLCKLFQTFKIKFFSSYF